MQPYFELQGELFAIFEKPLQTKTQQAIAIQEVLKTRCTDE